MIWHWYEASCIEAGSRDENVCDGFEADLALTLGTEAGSLRILF